MAQSLEKSAQNEPKQLNSLRDWLSSFSLVLQAIGATPLESGFYLLLLSLEEFGRVNSLSGLIQAMALFYITRKTVQLSYLEIIPAAKSLPLLLPASPIERMASVTGLWLVGSIYFSLFLIVPGIWFAIASCLAQQFVVLEGTRMIAAIDKSQTLTKGNIWTITRYVCLWPLITTAIAFGVAYGINVLLDFYSAASSVETRTAESAIRIVGSVCFATIGLATQVMATRMFVFLMHKSGHTTAIEKSIAKQQTS